MTYPGRLYLNDPSRDWPGDTIAGDCPDRKVRTPIWLRGEEITSDQYELIEDTALRARYGTRLLARARPGTKFYDRMASWPAAFEDAMKHFCRELLPQDLYSIYVHGHSTGGPFGHMLTQRVDNIVGVVGIENSPFANIYRAMIGYEWPGPFNELSIRTWRDLARDKGAEVRSLDVALPTQYHLAILLQSLRLPLPNRPRRIQNVVQTFTRKMQIYSKAGTSKL